MPILEKLTCQLLAHVGHSNSADNPHPLLIFLEMLKVVISSYYHLFHFSILFLDPRRNIFYNSFTSTHRQNYEIAK